MLHSACNSISHPPDHVLANIKDGLYAGGLQCMGCQAYRPASEFSLTYG